jgi:hypothetical protein
LNFIKELRHIRAESDVERISLHVVKKQHGRGLCFMDSQRMFAYQNPEHFSNDEQVSSARVSRKSVTNKVNTMLSRFHFLLLGILMGQCFPCVSSAAEPTGLNPMRPFETNASPRKKELRQREGTKFTEQLGRFQLSGDRVVFIPVKMGDENSLRVLENLTLERVLENLNESQADRLWTVTGVITEFRSVNYLLLSKAVVDTKEAVDEAK